MNQPLSLTEKATRAMKQANAKVIAEHRRQNRPLAVWQNGKVAWIPAPESMVGVRESAAQYQTKKASREERLKDRG
jgi:hypothetical protein